MIKSRNSVIKMTWWAHGGISKIFFHFSPSFARSSKISPIFHFDRGNNDQICHILCFKSMYLNFIASHFKKQFSCVDNVSFLYYNKVIYYYLSPLKRIFTFYQGEWIFFFSHFDLQLIGGKTFLMACNSFAV